MRPEFFSAPRPRGPLVLSVKTGKAPAVDGHDEVVRLVREALAAARVAGNLPALVGELEKAKAEALIGAGSPPPPSPEPPGAATENEEGRTEPDRLLSAHEAAELIGMSSWWVRQNRGALHAVTLPGGRYKFSRRKLARWIERRTL